MTQDITISYRIALPDGALAFDFRFSADQFVLRQADDRPPSAWTALDHHQCPTCPLDVETTPICPAARAIAGVLSELGDRWSTEKVDAAVERDGRAITIKTDLQTVLGAIFGLIGPTSGCPQLAPLRPMARMHAPFVPIEETVARSAALYLLGRYFAAQDGQDVDFSLDGLQAMYQELSGVNIALAERLQSAEKKDAARNAIALLDMRAASADISLDDKLENLRAAFGPMSGFSSRQPR